MSGDQRAPKRTGFIIGRWLASCGRQRRYRVMSADGADGKCTIYGGEPQHRCTAAEGADLGYPRATFADERYLRITRRCRSMAI